MSGKKNNKARRKSKNNVSNKSVDKSSVEKLMKCFADGTTNLNEAIVGSSSGVSTSIADISSGVSTSIAAKGASSVKGHIAGEALNIDGTKTIKDTDCSMVVDNNLGGHAGADLEVNIAPPIQQLSSSLPTIAVAGENSVTYRSRKELEVSELKLKKLLSDKELELQKTRIDYAQHRLCDKEIETENKRLKEDRTKGNEARRKIMQNIEEKYKNDLVKATNEKENAIIERNTFKGELEAFNKSHGITLESLKTLSAELQANKHDLEKSGEMINKLKLELKNEKEDYEKYKNQNQKAFEEIVAKNKEDCHKLQVLNTSLTEELNSHKLDLVKAGQKLTEAYKELTSNKDDYNKCKEELLTKNKNDFQKLQELNVSLKLNLIKADEKLIERDEELKINQEHFKKCESENKKKFEELLTKNKEDFNKLQEQNTSLTEELNSHKLDLVKADKKLIETDEELKINKEHFKKCTSENKKKFDDLLLKNKEDFNKLQVQNTSLTEKLNSHKLDLVKADKKLIKAIEVINHLNSVVNEINENSISQQNEITMLKCQAKKDTNTIVSLNAKVIENEQKIEDVSNELEELTKLELHSRKLNDETFTELKRCKLQIISKDNKLKVALKKQANTYENKIDKMEANHKTEIVILETNHSTELTDLKTKFEITVEEIGNTTEKQKEEELRKVHKFYDSQIDKMNTEIHQFADDATKDKEESLQKVRHYFNGRIEDINNHHAENLKEKETVFNVKKEMFVEKIDKMNENKKKFISQTRGYVDGKVNSRKYTPWGNKINATKVIQFLDDYE